MPVFVLGVKGMTNLENNSTESTFLTSKSTIGIVLFVLLCVLVPDIPISVIDGTKALGAAIHDAGFCLFDTH